MSKIKRFWFPLRELRFNKQASYVRDFYNKNC